MVNEVLVGGLSVDIVLDDAVVIEVDGESHFCHYRQGEPWHELGPTVLKRRILQTQGWRYVNVPFFEWQLSTNDDAWKEDYILGKLRQSGYAR